jgi:hypothetical protein
MRIQRFMATTRFTAFCFLLLVAVCAGAADQPPLREPQRVSPTPATPNAGTSPATVPAKPERPPVPQTTPKKTAADPAAEPDAPQPSAAKLDLESLEARLRETDAIGLMTKLTLKSQVDDLLDRVRAYHEGTVTVQLVELRQPYDSLILKVLALLQDKDPPLASAIATSREAIWAILADRAKFSKL